MIDLKEIEQNALKIIETYLGEKEIFIVDITILPANIITIQIDSLLGIAIQDCIILSKNIEQTLDRDKEDFQLTVTSAGLTTPFKVIKQYQKNIGNEIEIFTTDNEKIIAELISVNKNEIEISQKKLEKVEGYKKKQEIITKRTLSYEKIKSVKQKIDF